MVYAFWPSVLFSSIAGVFLINIEFIIPFFILVYCYGRIVWILTRRISLNSFKDKTSVQTTQDDNFQLARTNTIKTFLSVGVCFIICWSNNSVYYFMYNLGYKANWNGTYSQFTVLMVFLNCTINPFIYFIKYRDYQEALRALCGWQKQKRQGYM